VSTDVDTADTTTDVDVSTQTEVETTTAERDRTVNRTPTAPVATSTRRHTRLE
jgi:hypothetical protein